MPDSDAFIHPYKLGDLKVVPCSPVIGAEIRNIDISKELSAEIIVSLIQA